MQDVENMDAMNLNALWVAAPMCWLRKLCPAAFMLIATIIQADESCTLGRSIDPVELTGRELPDIT